MEGRTQDLEEGSFPSTYVRKINVAAAAPKTVERCSFLFFSIPPFFIAPRRSRLSQRSYRAGRAARGPSSPYRALCTAISTSTLGVYNVIWQGAEAGGDLLAYCVFWFASIPIHSYGA